MVEHRTVAPDVAGPIPVTHPIFPVGFSTGLRSSAADLSRLSFTVTGATKSAADAQGEIVGATVRQRLAADEVSSATLFKISFGVEQSKVVCELIRIPGEDPPLVQRKGRVCDLLPSAARRDWTDSSKLC